MPNNETALRSRVYRFVQREGLVQRRRTHIAQNTRHDKEIEDDFVNVVNEYISNMKLPASAIVNIDETNVNYDEPSSTTLAPRGQRTISVRGVDSSNRCTVLLGVSLAGEKLPAFIIFNGTRNGRIAREVSGDVMRRGFPNDVVMSVQKKGWVDEELMIEWIDKVWRPWIDSHNLKFSYLLMDSFKVFLKK